MMLQQSKAKAMRARYRPRSCDMEGGVKRAVYVKQLHGLFATVEEELLSVRWNVRGRRSVQDVQKNMYNVCKAIAWLTVCRYDTLFDKVK